ncbi:MAG: flavodoxin family protein [Phycisphaerales bacterium]|nr:MAG: flavodoxin family protein [Phycisphaerales bacterium]
MKVLGISTSPRIKGNSDLLLREALAGAESAGAQVEYVNLRDYKIGPCIECNACFTTGQCSVQDDYQAMLKKILEADRLVFATPVFFMSVCAQAKNLIDRGQCLWAHKYVLKKESLTTGCDRRAMVIAVGGSKSKKQFESIRLTMMTYFDALDINFAINLFVGQVDDVGEVRGRPSALEQAYQLGSQLASAEAPPEKSIDVELI